MKIVVLDGYTENPGDLSWGGLEALGELTVYDRTANSDIVGRIGGVEAVLTNKTPISRETLEACPGLRYIGVLATGYNVVDTAAAKERGVVVTNIPTYGTAAVAQFAMALLLEVCHHIGHHDAAVKQGRWAACPDFTFWDMPLIELAHLTFGAVGFGRIGQATAKLAAAFGMRVVAYDEYQSPEGAALAEYLPLDELLRVSDVVSLHCPLLPSTEGMINRENIAKMKDSAILLNTSRGPLVNEADLADALNEGRLYAAAVDVVSTEPILPDNPLLTAKNCLITPHIAWAPRASRQRLMDIAVENLRAWQEGRPQNVVNG